MGRGWVFIFIRVSNRKFSVFIPRVSRIHFSDRITTSQKESIYSRIIVVVILMGRTAV